MPLTACPRCGVPVDVVRRQVSRPELYLNGVEVWTLDPNLPMYTAAGHPIEPKHGAYRRGYVPHVLTCRGL